MVPRLTFQVGLRLRFRTHRRVRSLLALVLAIAACVAVDAASAVAAPLSTDRIGVDLFTYTSNGQLGPNDLTAASAAGVGLARVQLIQGTNADPVVTLAAAAHLRIYPMLGLPQQLTPSAAATAMAQYVTAFAARYGPNGAFWSQNPQLPYLPVERFEVGNEPNMPLQYVQDETHLHWTDPAAYAEVYNAARAALHRVDATGVAVVGGLANSDGGGVDLGTVEQWLAALPAGSVDAVGFHMYLPLTSSLEPDTEALRAWMNGHGFQNAPLDVNEMGACDVTAQTTMEVPCFLPNISSADWGSATAHFEQWALCSPAMNVANVQVFRWGDLPWTDRDAFLALVSSEGALTPYGQAYLGESQVLTTKGCPPENSSLPSISGAPLIGQVLAAVPGSWDPAPTMGLAYQWSRCDTDGQNCASLPGATSQTYQVQSGDVGHTLVVSVTAWNGAGTNTADSLPTAAVIASAQPTTSGNATSVGTTPPTPPAAPSGHRLRRHRRHHSVTVVATVANVSPARRFQVAWIRTRRRTLTVAVRVKLPPPQMGVRARQRQEDVRLHVAYRRFSPTTHSRVVVFTATLATGHWAIDVMCVSRCGRDASRPLRLTVVVPRVAFRW